MAVELRFRQILEGQQAHAEMKKSARELGDEAKRTAAEYRLLQKATGATGEELQRAKNAAEQAAGAYKKAQVEVRSLTDLIQKLGAEGKNASEPFQQLSSGAGAFNSVSNVMRGNLAGIGSELSAISNLTKSGLFSPVVASAALAGSALLAVTGIVAKLALEESSLVEQQSNNAVRTGLSLKEYGVWSQVAANAGINAHALVTSVRTLSKAMDENAEEGKIAKRALSELFGGTAQAAQVASKPALEFLFAFDEALQKVGSSSLRAERTMQVFAKGGLEILPVLNGQLREQFKLVQDIGVGYDELSSKHLQRLDASVDLLNTQWTAFKQNLAETVAGPLAALITGFNVLFALGSRPPGPKQYITDSITGERFDAYTHRRIDTSEESEEKEVQAEAAEKRKAEEEFRAQRRTDAAKIEALDKKRPRFGNSEQQAVEALQEQLDKAKDKAKDDKAAFRAEDYAKDKSLVDSLTVQIAHTKELAAEEKKLREARQQALDARTEEQFGPAYKIYANRDKQVRELADKGTLSKGDRARLTAQINETANIEIGTQDEKGDKELRLEQVKERGKRTEQYLKQFEAAFKKQEQEEVKATEESVRVFDAGFTRDRGALVSQAGKQQRLADLTLDRQPTAAASEARSRELGLAQQLYDLDLKRSGFLRDLADKEVSGAEKQKLEAEALTQEAKAQADIKEATRKAEEDFLIKSLEIEKKKREEANKLGQDLFTAATTRGGLRDFDRTLGRQTATKIAGNVLEGPIRGVTSELGMIGQASGLGGILKGTLFDPENGKSPEIKSRDANTTALDRLTDTLSGGAGTAGASTVSSPLSKIPGPLGSLFRRVLGGGGGSLSAAGGDGAFALPFSAPSLSAGSQSVLDALYPSAIGGGSASSGRTTLASVLGLPEQLVGPTAESSLYSQIAAAGTGAGRLAALSGTGGAFSAFKAGGSILDLRTLVPGKDFSVPLGEGSATTYSSLSGAAKAGSVVGTAGTLAAGAFGVYSGIKQGNVKGYSSAVASGAGAAAALDPELISKSVLATVALGASLFSALGPDPYKKRQDEITRGMRENQWFAPQALDSTRDIYGNRLGFNFRGGLGEVGQTYASGITGWNANYTQPVFGSNPTSPSARNDHGGAALIGNLNITAMDTKSIVDNHPAIAEAVWQATNAGNQRLQAAVQRNVGLQ